MEPVLDVLYEKHIEETAARRLFSEQERSFLDNLTPEQKRRFHEILDSWAELNAQETENAFREGFRQGGKMVLTFLEDEK